MKKFILPVIVLIVLILVGVAFGLGSNSAVTLHEFKPGGNWYQLVWTTKGVTALACVGFFLLCFGAFFSIPAAVPFISKYFLLLAGALFVGAGVLMLMTPGAVYSHGEPLELTASYIAACVLVLVAGGLELVGACVGFLPEKK